MTLASAHNERISGILGQPVTIAHRRSSDHAPPRAAAARPADSPPDPADLTRRIAKGDEDAFSEFYDHWFARALAITRRITRRDESTCLDIVQVVMLRAARTLPPLADEASLTRWMTRALHRAAIDRFRAEARADRRDRHAARSRPPNAPSDATDPHEREEQIAWLRDELEAIPQPDRLALLARFSQSRTLAGVGSMLGLSGPAAHGRIRRTLERLRAKAREDFHD